MSEFDLVPGDYRLRMQQNALLKIYGLALLTIVLLCGVLYAGLHLAQQQVQADLESLKVQRATQVAQTQNYQQLRADRQQLKDHSVRLNELAGPAAVQPLMQAVEQAAAREQVWLHHWRYNKAVNPQGAARAELHGDASDHGALASFVQQLLLTPTIADVDISASTLHGDGTVLGQEHTKVLFRLQLALRSDPADEGSS